MFENRLFGNMKNSLKSTLHSEPVQRTLLSWGHGWKSEHLSCNRTKTSVSTLDPNSHIPYVPKALYTYSPMHLMALCTYGPMYLWPYVPITPRLRPRGPWSGPPYRGASGVCRNLDLKKKVLFCAAFGDNLMWGTSWSPLGTLLGLCTYSPMYL